MREKYFQKQISCNAEYEESRLKAFSSSISTRNSFRIYENGTARIHYCEGTISDTDGFREAETKSSRPYDFELCTQQRSRDLTEKPLSDKELLAEAEDLIDILRTRYPDFIFSGDISKTAVMTHWTGEAGMDLSDTDCVIITGLGFKHKDSKDIHDGWFGVSDRTYSRDRILAMAEDYLGSYHTMCTLPEEVIIQSHGMFSSALLSYLNGEAIALGTSLLSGKIGQDVFSDKVTLFHDAAGDNAFLFQFWDGEGFSVPDDMQMLIDKGRVLFGISDRRTAQKYNIPHTFGAHHSYADLPQPGRIAHRFQGSGKTAKELLDGRYAIVPLMCSGGGFNEKGDYAMPVQNSLLLDGEKVLGRLPAFTISGNLFDFFGKDFIGVPCDEGIIREKNNQLIRVKAQLIE